MRRTVATLMLVAASPATLLAACAPASPPGQVVERAPAPIAEEPDLPMLMWAQGGLATDLPGRAAKVDGVDAVATLWSDTLGMTGSRRADGTVVDRFDEGWRLPVQATAIVPDQWAAVLDDEAGREAVALLRPGTILVAAPFATGRGLDIGGTLDLVGQPGMRIVAVIEDGLVGSGELVLHADDAASAGITRGPSLLIETSLTTGSERDDLGRRLAALAPPEAPARVVDTADPAIGRDAAVVLSLPRIKERFGEFAYRPHDGSREVDADPLWEQANIVRVEVPILGVVRCHRLIIDDLVAALAEVVQTGLAHAIDPETYDGCWYPRRISTERHSLSSHSWGIALDINVDLELPGLGPPPDPAVVAIFRRHGFRWGGEFLTPDNHHFEWVGGIVTPFPMPEAAIRTPDQREL